MDVLLLYTIVFFILVWGGYGWYKHKNSRLPPGPFPLPLLGNVLQIPGTAPWEKLQYWADKYGPVMTMKFGATTAIVLNTRESARRLLENRANISSDRPRLNSFGEYFFKFFPITMKYGPEWLGIHQVQIGVLNPKATRESADIQRLAVHRYMWELLRGGEMGERIQWLSMHSMSALIFGVPMGTLTAEDVSRQQAVVDLAISSIGLITLLLDSFPFLEYIPGVRRAAVKKADRHYQSISKLLDDKLESAVQSPTWSMARASYQNRPKSMTWEGFRMAILEMYLAGNGGTTITMRMVVLMAALHLEEVAHAQEEIDRVVGPDRQPTIEDLDKLPRLRALFTECIRWRPIAPFSFPHALSEETEFMGYRIPPNALVFANQWAYNQDKDTYGDPQNFRPQRWIDDPDLPQPSGFGFGRRSCPGRYTATSLISVAFASLVWGYDLGVKEGITEHSVKATSFVIFDGDTSGITYKCRSEKHRQVIERDWNAVNPDISGLLNDLGDALGM